MHRLHFRIVDPEDMNLDLEAGDEIVAALRELLQS
jgi:hypothetical protein